MPALERELFYFFLIFMKLILSGRFEELGKVIRAILFWFSEKNCKKELARAFEETKNGKAALTEQPFHFLHITFSCPTPSG